MNLYVGNLSQTVTTADLDVIFKGLGRVIFARLAQGDEDQDARGYAFVWVTNERQAQLAVGAMDGKYLKGQRLIIHPVRDRARLARALRALNARSGPDQAAAELSPLKGS
ncbi:MAG TPA: RNA-binding protein [Acidiferrobacter sp.]|nr:RNA-binding protein [Acidiferrobacter sp.]